MRPLTKDKSLITRKIAFLNWAKFKCRYNFRIGIKYVIIIINNY